MTGVQTCALPISYAREFEARYGPRNTFGGHAWDAVKLVVAAMEKAGTDRAKLRTAIESTKNYADLGFKVPLFQSHGVGNRRYIELAGPGANGVVFPAGKLLVADQLPDNDPQRAVLQAYAREFEARYGPRNTFGGHAWDAVKLVVAAMEKAGTDRAKLRTAIESTRNFVGITGVFDFSPAEHNGLDRRAVVMTEIVDGQWRLAK